MHSCCAAVMAMEIGRPTYHGTASPRMSRGARPYLSETWSLAAVNGVSTMSINMVNSFTI